ncbi:response regulator transcription factor [bacterium]|nr:response regulator transcription factor [bacterium]
MISIVLVEDHAVVRAGLRELLEKHPDFQVVGEAGTLTEARRLLPTLAHDVTILDLDMPDGQAEHFLTRLRGRGSQAVLILSMHIDPRRVRDCLDAGARGYLVKSASPEEFYASIMAVHSGSIYLHRDVAFSASDLYARVHTSLLTERESKVLTAIAQGQTNEAIARSLGISVSRLKSHIRSLFSRFGVNDRISLIRDASAKGFIESSD